MTAVSTRSFYVEQVHDVTVLSFTVSMLIERNYEFVSEELFELVEYVISNGPIQVVVDLSSVREIDDWGLAMLRAFHDTIESSGGTSILSRISHSVAGTIKDAGLTSFFRTRETRGEAIRSFATM